jgi:hypothetical protein
MGKYRLQIKIDFSTFDGSKSKFLLPPGGCAHPDDNREGRWSSGGERF